METKEYEISLARKEIVFKSNDLVREAKFDLTTNEQKLILWAVSKIKREDQEFTEYDLPVAEFCELMGIEKCRKNRRNLEEVLDRLALKSFWMDREDGARTRIQWFITSVIKDGIIKIRFHPDLRPYLLGLTKRYTAFELETIVHMKSKYAIRFYELMRCNLWTGKYTAGIADLKEWLQCGTEYPDITNFKRRVLDVAVQEINEKTDLIVDYKLTRTGRYITDVVFSIDQNPFYAHDHID